MGAREKPRHVPPLLQDAAVVAKRDATMRRPRRQEKKVARELGGSRQPGSGAFGLKGDVRRRSASFPMLIECKRVSGKESIRIELGVLAKISSEAGQTGAYPALEIQFDEEVVRQFSLRLRVSPPSADWIAVPLVVFRAMLEGLGEA
jgi:Holliday junction resolvase